MSRKSASVETTTGKAESKSSTCRCDADLLSAAAGERGSPKSFLGKQPSRYTIDLSTDPKNRYDHIATHMQQHLATASLNGLFTDIISSIAPPPFFKAVNFLAKTLLRRVYSQEEQHELEGIHKATKVPMHLLVAFNVLLDILLGCTSGGARIRGPGCKNHDTESQILHFRTLDWGMEPLRNLILTLDFVQKPDGPVVHSVVTYFGFVGVITGVRRGFSMSLNFRPHHDSQTLTKRLRFRAHQILVILGMRPSISSTLRSQLFHGPIERGLLTSERKELMLRGPVASSVPFEQEREMDHFIRILSRSPSTAAYVICCTSQRVYNIEVDNRHTSVTTSKDFLTTCNHDLVDEIGSTTNLVDLADTTVNEAIGMSDLVKWSRTRKTRMEKMRTKVLNRRRTRTTHLDRYPLLAEDVLKMMNDDEITNDETHYGVLMDPAQGKIVWVRAYDGPDWDEGEL